MGTPGSEVLTIRFAWVCIVQDVEGQQVLRSRYGYRAKTIAGPQYWCFEGKSLSEIRQGLESGESNE